MAQVVVNPRKLYLKKGVSAVKNLLLFLVLAIVAVSSRPVYAQTCQDGNDGMKSKPCWEVNLLWSGRNLGFVEQNIRDEWDRLGILKQCMDVASGRGRVTAMQLAVAAAKANQDDYAYRIARSTQMHNNDALRTIDAAGVATIANWLRTR
jgi:hypothetical protein